MSADYAVTYTSVYFKARSWSIPSEDPYEEAARQLLEQAPRSPEYVLDPIEMKNHVPVYIPEPEHPEDLVPAEDEAPIETYITEGTTNVTYYHYYSITSRRADIPEADMPPRKRLLLTAPRPGSVDTVETRVRDSAEILEEDVWPALERGQLKGVSYPGIEERERLAYEQESMETRQALARSEAYSRALEVRVIVLETQARRHEWQRQDADDRTTRHIKRIQALEARARDDTLEDNGSSA
ncbi:hypothetical protein Tco_0930926 [Tanacetum coccineum]